MNLKSIYTYLGYLFLLRIKYFLISFELAPTFKNVLYSFFPPSHKCSNSEANLNLLRYMEYIFNLICYQKFQLFKRFFQFSIERKPNVIFKPFTVSAGDAVFSAVPIKVIYVVKLHTLSNWIKGKYGSKQDYITVIKNGCMLAEVIPQSRDAASGRVNSLMEYLNKELIML